MLVTFGAGELILLVSRLTLESGFEEPGKLARG